MKLVTAAQMKEIDRISIEERGVPAADLMEEAGKAAATDLMENFPVGPVAVLCGKGKNGGDGFVAARHLHDSGWDVTVFYDQAPPDDTPILQQMWEQIPEEVEKVALSEVENLTERLSGFVSAVDALLGIGFSGEAKAPYADWINALNAANLMVLSVDIASGLDPDEGWANPAVHAMKTVTMGLPKLGMVRRSGAYYSGAIAVEPLLFPEDLLESASDAYQTLTQGGAHELLPLRSPDAHKGTFGMCLVVAGSSTMPGASILAGIGALRGGCGLVRMHVPESVCNIAAMSLPEAMLTRVGEGRDEHRKLSKKDMKTILLRVDSIALGPGVGQSQGTKEFVAQMMEEIALPMVIDADAINIISQVEGLANHLSGQHILTPHPGELARLMRLNITDIQGDRWKYAREAANHFGCVVLLKGYGTLIAEPEGPVTHIPSGNTAWARGGAGDVLTGLIGSLLAQGLSPANAAKLGAFVHGMAADIYTRDLSARGAITRDIADCIPQAFRELEG